MNKAYNTDILKIKSFPSNYDIVYTDPPWEQRMVRLFETMIAKDGGARAGNSIEAILNKLGSLSDTSKPLFIEYGMKGYGLVEEIMKHNGHKLNETQILMQSMGRPFVVMSFNTDFIIDSKLKGFNIVKHTVIGTGAKLVVDPFAGIGQTAKAVIKSGANYVGYELNPKRYERLKKVTG